MTEDARTLILRLLREIRADMNGMRETLQTQTAKPGALERRMVEVQGSVAPAVGFSVSTNARDRSAAERIDRPTGTATDLKARVEALEQKA